jgi:magnesium-transporting ATPase (P-type)
VALRTLAEKVGFLSDPPAVLEAYEREVNRPADAEERAVLASTVYAKAFERVQLLEFDRARKMMSVVCSR